MSSASSSSLARRARVLGAATPKNASSSSSSSSVARRRSTVSRRGVRDDDHHQHHHRDAVGLDDEEENRRTRGRRTTLIATVASTMTMAMSASTASAAFANPLRALGDARKASNARFIVGPVALSRGRLAALRRDVAYDGDDKDAVVGDIKERLTSATLDCSTPRDALQAYSNVKDVCTLGILARSVTAGPGANNAPGTEAYVDVYAALETTRGTFRVLEDVLTSTSAREDASARDAAFNACDAALRAFAEALLACFGFDDAAREDVKSAVPGAFAR